MTFSFSFFVSHKFRELPSRGLPSGCPLCSPVRSMCPLQLASFAASSVHAAKGGRGALPSAVWNASIDACVAPAPKLVLQAAADGTGKASAVLVLPRKLAHHEEC